MGHCSVFDCQIAPGCDQPMEAHENQCSCPDCGAVCTGRYEGCPDVWATATVALVAPPHRRDRKRRKTSARGEPVTTPPTAAATTAWSAESADDTNAVAPTNDDAVPTTGNALPTNGDTHPAGNGDGGRERSDSEFDEGIELLRAALEDIHHERERLEEPRAVTGTSRARRPRPEAPDDDTNGSTADGPELVPQPRGRRQRNGNGWRESTGEPGTKPVPARRRARNPVPVDDEATTGGAGPEEGVDVLKAAVEELERRRGPADQALPRQKSAAKLKRVDLPPPAVHTPFETEPARRVPSTDRRRRGIVVAAILASVAVIAGGIVAGASLRGGGGSSNDTANPRTPPTSARLDLGTFAVVDGVDGERAWTLSGADGTKFEGELTFTNETDAPIAVSHTEIIPKSLAASVDQIRFSPQPVVIEPDPVVQFNVTAPADGTVTARYSIDVPPEGAERSRLADWASDLQDEQRRRGAPVTNVPNLPGADTPSTNKSGNGNGGGKGNGSAAKPSAPPAGGGAPAPAPPPQPPPPPPEAPGTIVIRVISYDGTGSFGFSGPGGGLSVTTAGSPNGSGQSAAMSVSPGTYAWTQVSLEPGYHLQVIDCTDRDAGPFEQRSTVSGATATFNVQPGESVTCTWINRR